MLLQWGHGDGAVEEFAGSNGQCVCLSASMGPRRWSRGRVTELQSLDDRKPASMGPRRWSRGRGFHGRGDRPGVHASMGPRRWSRGRDAIIKVSREQYQGFNGATAMEPWKRDAMVAAVDLLHMLQWGHGDGAVEERLQCAAG